MEAVATIHGQGTAEPEWARCAWLWARPHTPAAALLGTAKRLLVVAPHPDDEILACAGLMREAAASGLAVDVAAVTDGEACYPGETWWTPQRLARQRRQELREAIDTLGVPQAVITHLGIGDGMVSAAEAALCDTLSSMIDTDTLVLAPWRHDGHPDHEASGRAAQRAADAIGARYLEYPVWGWHWLQPGAAPQAWAHPRVLDIEPHRLHKQAAIACFRTQTGAVERLAAPPILPAQVLERFARPHEVFLA